MGRLDDLFLSLAVLITFQLVILTSFALGTVGRRLRGPQPEFSRKLVRFNLIFLEPGIVFWATWGLHPETEQIILPFAGIAMVVGGFLFGMLLAPAVGLTGARRAVYLISASLGNHGFTLCASLCYLWLGEEGLGLAAIFTFYFTPYVFLILFPFAEKYSPQIANEQPPRFAFWKTFVSWNYLPLYATLAAVILLLAGVERPAWDVPLIFAILPTVGLYYVTLGLSFDTRRLTVSAREFFSYAWIKFALVPALTFVLVVAFEILSGYTVSRTIRVVLTIMSFAPAATYSVVAAVLYDLDQDFAGGLFVTNVVAFLFLVLPVLAFLI